MKTTQQMLASALIALATVGVVDHAFATTETLDIGLNVLINNQAPVGDAPWVNARFLDLGFLGAPGVAPGFSAFKNAVELQITTTKVRNPSSGPAFTAEQLANFGLSQHPNLGVVEGAGNLAPGESLNYLLFNFNPSKDASKLRMSWAGADGFGFPASASPIGFQSAIAENGISAFPQSGLFDVIVYFSLGPDRQYSDSKIVFYYDGDIGSDQNIDPSDFNFLSAPIPGVDTPSGGFLAAGLLVTNFGTVGGSSAAALQAAVPEASTWALLGIGLVVVFLGVRREVR
jgi:hypothetical protein